MSISNKYIKACTLGGNYQVLQHVLFFIIVLIAWSQTLWLLFDQPYEWGRTYLGILIFLLVAITVPAVGMTNLLAWRLYRREKRLELGFEDLETPARKSKHQLSVGIVLLFYAIASCVVIFFLVGSTMSLAAAKLILISFHSVFVVLGLSFGIYTICRICFSTEQLLESDSK